jgi:hypothetical protein
MQQQMWFDDEFEALNLMISNSKRLAGFLFPHLKPDSAYARLKSCLSHDKDERLTFGQIIAAMKFCECYEPLLFPARVSPKDEEVKLVEAISGATETLNKAMRQLENLRTRTSI